MKMKRLILMFACLLAGTTSLAQAEPTKLFKSWVFDSPISAYTKPEGYYDCSSDFGGPARCIDAVDFLGQPFGAVLSFNDQRLVSVMLVADFDQDLYVKAIGALAKTFSMVLMRGSDDQLDLVDLIHTAGSADVYRTRVNDYEALNLSKSQLSYFFIEQPIAAIKARTSANDATLKAPADVRSAELMVTETDDQALLMITFSLPRLTLSKMVETLKKTPTEDF
jgi:hypothetical protein